MGLTRRDFLRLSFESLALAVLSLALPRLPARAEPVRPPGAVVEELFVSLCLRCGRCLQACPTGVIVLSDGSDRLVAVGTPKLDPRLGPCEALYGRCEGVLPCVKACPTGALRALPAERIKLGTVVLHRARCIAWQRDGGCLVCREACPVEEAILVEGRKPHFEPEPCIGCGRCVNACPAEPKALELVAEGARRVARP